MLPKAHRGRLAAWAYTCSFVAVPVLGFLSLWLTTHSLFGIPGWRILLLVGALGAAVVMLMRRGLPESPRWLAGVGRAEDAWAAVRQFEADAPTTPSAPEGRIHCANGRVAHHGDQPDPAALGVALPGAPRHAGGVSLFQSFGYYGFGTLAALVLVSRGYDVTSSLLFTALSYLGYPIGSVLAIPLLKWFERKYLVMATIAAMAAFGLLFATVDNTVADRGVRLPDHRHQQRLLQRLPRLSGRDLPDRRAGYRGRLDVFAVAFVQRGYCRSS